jgi:hypothetical protein
MLALVTDVTDSYLEFTVPQLINDNTQAEYLFDTFSEKVGS